MLKKLLQCWRATSQIKWEAPPHCVCMVPTEGRMPVVVSLRDEVIDVQEQTTQLVC